MPSTQKRGWGSLYVSHQFVKWLAHRRGGGGHYILVAFEWKNSKILILYKSRYHSFIIAKRYTSETNRYKFFFKLVLESL